MNHVLERLRFVYAQDRDELTEADKVDICDGSQVLTELGAEQGFRLYKVRGLSGRPFWFCHDAVCVNDSRVRAREGILRAWRAKLTKETLLGTGIRVDDEQASLPVRPHLGPDAVAETTPLPDHLKEPGAHDPADHQIQDAQGPTVRVLDPPQRILYPRLPVGHLLVMLCLDRLRREEVMGQLESDFERNCERYCTRRATVLFWRDGLECIGPFVLQFVAKEVFNQVKRMIAGGD